MFQGQTYVLKVASTKTRSDRIGPGWITDRITEKKKKKKKKKTKKKKKKKKKEKKIQKNQIVYELAINKE